MRRPGLTVGEALSRFFVRVDTGGSCGRDGFRTDDVETLKVDYSGVDRSVKARSEIIAQGIICSRAAGRRCSAQLVPGEHGWY